jgi:hypothetical protein
MPKPDRKALLKRIAHLEEELKGMQFTFDLEWKRGMQATREWQKATNRKDTWPDLGALLKWQFDRITALRAALMRYGRHDDEENDRPCSWHSSGRDACDCGLDEALRIPPPSPKKEAK